MFSFSMKSLTYYKRVFWPFSRVKLEKRRELGEQKVIFVTEFAYKPAALNDPSLSLQLGSVNRAELILRASLVPSRPR